MGKAMNPTYGEHRMCSRKTRYPGEHGAKRAARAMRMRAYECPICRGWHLTKIDHDGPRQ